MRHLGQIAQRAELLGGRIDLVTADEVLAFVADAAGQGRKAVIANHNLHSLHLVRKDRDMAALFEIADLIEVDSMPLLLWGRLMGLKTSRAHRSTYLDWREQFWSIAAARRWRVFYLGAAPGVAEAAADKLMKQWPGVEIATRHGYFDHAPGSAENAAVVRQINDFRPDILLVGMGMPLQEAWIARNFDSLEQGVVLPVGGAFDYEAGVQIAAPRFLGAMGLEWLFRLACQPRRLFSRYMIEPWKLVRSAMNDVSRLVGGRAARTEARLLGRGGPILALETVLKARPASLAA
jgi:N-acetylglucosaminyldiphosphoundecaprenol N-acetyl-beta-D-mannosaminyltransferase